MLVLCHEDHRPAMEGDVVRLRDGATGVLKAFASGSYMVLVEGPDGTGSLPISYCGLSYKDVPEPKALGADTLTVRDRYVLALLPLFASGRSASCMNTVIEKAFEAADICMKRRG